MNIDQFKNYSVPFPLQADAYTISSDAFASEKAREKSVYNVTNRISPAKTFPDIAKDSRMVFFGLQDYIRRNLTQPIAARDVLKSKEFMDRACSFGGALPFNEDMWYTIVEDYDGYLPIKIKGLPEGSVFFPNEPVIEVSAEDGFGELAAHVESALLGMWSNLTCRATITAHFKNIITNYLVNECGHEPNNADAISDWFIHDFGMRASSCVEESELFGKAHLLFFNGTDTFNAAYSAWRDSENKNLPFGKSILALAHRNILGFENDNTDGEMDCFTKLYNLSQQYGGIASYVSDCYNFKNAVNKLESIIDKHPNDSTAIVSRPDSGNAKENISYILNKNKSRLRFIEGNGVKPKALLDILSCLKNSDLVSRGIFGIGGYLRNSCNRDALSSKFALSSIGNEDRPVCKLSEELGKISIPGPNIIHRNGDNTSVHMKGDMPEACNALKLYYDNGGYSDTCLEDFNVIRERANRDFRVNSGFALDNPDYGIGDGHMSDSIRKIRNETFNKHKDV